MASSLDTYTADEKFTNYITLVVALKFTKEGLQDFVKKSMNDMYVKLSTKCTGSLPCDIDCSKLHDSRFDQWCLSCSKWREELCRYMRYPGHVKRVHWKYFESSSWGRDSKASTINQIANVFVHNCKDPIRSCTNDISNVVSLFENCRYFEIGQNKDLMKRIRAVRNKHFAHNKSYMLTEEDLILCLDTLLDCLDHRSIRTNQSCKEAEEIITSLKLKSQRLKCTVITNLLSVLQDFPRTRAMQTKIDQFMENNLQESGGGQEKRNKQIVYGGFILAFILSVLIILIRSSDLSSSKETYSQNTDSFELQGDCKTMDFSFPWKSDIHFDYFIKAHKHFVGREWLIEDIAYKLLNTDERGVLLAAEIGFGKSALVSHISCSSSKLSSAFPIYEHLVGIHLCRYDSESTLTPGIFVRNMAGGLAKVLPEFGNIIQTDNMANEYLSSKKCIEEPYGCFDFGILDPLRKANLESNRYVFIIDALDECIEIGSKNIFSLLSERIHQLPDNFKFFFTSRNISQIRGYLPPQIFIYQNPLFWENNLEDIKKFIRRRLENVTVNEQIVNLLSSSDLDKNVRKLADHVNGNFLFLIHAFDFWIKVGDVSKFPDNAEHIYRLNLKRVFGKTENMFEKVRSIFEILCASHGSIKEESLFKILEVNDRHKKLVFSRFISNELSHFLQKTSENIGFYHKRIADFFSKQDKMDNEFYISKQNGHQIISQYWLSQLSELNLVVNRSNLIDIFRHVASSMNITVKKQLIDVVHQRINESEYRFLMHYTAASINSYQTMKLVIQSISRPDIDERDFGNLTASYIAAAYGNEYCLRALIESGANVNFERPQPVFSQYPLELDLITLCKYNTHWGYSLLNIASQNGNTGVVKLLMQYKVNLCHDTAIGLNSFHLASEQGHVPILTLLMSSTDCDWTSSFNHSLYLAAKNGHVHVVNYLLTQNAIDHCLPCNDTIYWVPKRKERLQSRDPRLHSERDDKYYVLKDDQRLLFCESALDIAVRNNHLDVVKMLIKRKVNALKCSNARGMTPMITAAVFKQKDILLYFIKSGLPLNDTCRAVHRRQYINDSMLCSKGMTFWHMVTIYSEFEILASLSKMQIDHSLWNATDLYGATPIHHACCNNYFTRFYFDVGLHLADRTLNGSTPVHYAALCGNIFILKEILTINKPLILNVRDNSNKNILHYLALTTAEIMTINWLYQKIMDNYERLISERDAEGRTPLHYSAMTGQHFLITDKNVEIKINSLNYLIRDYFNMSVLDVLFEHMPGFQPKFGYYVSKLPYNCSLTDLFGRPGCSNLRVQILDTFEQFAFEAFSALNNTNLLKERDVFTFMYKALGKNRFYLFYMIKYFYPNFYYTVSNKKVKLFLRLLIRKSTYPSLLLSSLFLHDLIENFCKNDQQDGSLWYILYDSHRKFWPIYEIFNDTRFTDKIETVLEKCKETRPLNAIMKGGNVFVLNFLDKRKLPAFDIENVVHLAPCIITRLKYFIPQMLYVVNHDIYRSNLDLVPYSHPEIVEMTVRRYSLYFHCCTLSCFRNQDTLSFVHIAAAKGFSNIIKIILKSAETDILECRNKYLIEPSQLAFFFNHSIPFQRKIDTKIFYQTEFVSLSFKVIMDFHTFVFPKQSAAWSCYQYLHKISRRSLKKLSCLTFLENEICQLIVGLYANDVSSIYRIYTLRKVLEYIDHGHRYPFNVIGYIQRVRTSCLRKKIVPYVHVEKFHRLNEQIQRHLCTGILASSRNSRDCLKQISVLSKIRKDINYKIQSCLQMLFPLSYLAYDRFIIQLPDLAQKDTIEMIQIMHAYASAPAFHNTHRYDYWDSLNSHFNNPFRVMTQTILTSNITEILSWIKHTEMIENIENPKSQNKKIFFMNPLTVYENMTKTIPN